MDHPLVCGVLIPQQMTQKTGHDVLSCVHLNLRQLHAKID